jgi:hypothetical protein
MDTRTWYQLRVQGHLDSSWSGWFGGMTITQHPDGTTTLVGPVADQAALYGLIAKMRNLGLVLLEVTQSSPSPDEGA